jgi:hypothetical protein
MLKKTLKKKSNNKEVKKNFIFAHNRILMKIGLVEKKKDEFRKQTELHYKKEHGKKKEAYTRKIDSKHKMKKYREDGLELHSVSKQIVHDFKEYQAKAYKKMIETIRIFNEECEDEINFLRKQETAFCNKYPPNFCDPNFEFSEDEDSKSESNKSKSESNKSKSSANYKKRDVSSFYDYYEQNRGEYGMGGPSKKFKSHKTRKNTSSR